MSALSGKHQTRASLRPLRDPLREAGRGVAAIPAEESCFLAHRPITLWQLALARPTLVGSWANACLLFYHSLCRLTADSRFLPVTNTSGVHTPMDCMHPLVEVLPSEMGMPAWQHIVLAAVALVTTDMKAKVTSSVDCCFSEPWIHELSPRPFPEGNAKDAAVSKEAESADKHADRWLECGHDASNALTSCRAAFRTNLGVKLLREIPYLSALRGWGAHEVVGVAGRSWHSAIGSSVDPAVDLAVNNSLRALWTRRWCRAGSVTANLEVVSAGTAHRPGTNRVRQRRSATSEACRTGVRNAAPAGEAFATRAAWSSVQVPIHQFNNISSLANLGIEPNIGESSDGEIFGYGLGSRSFFDRIRGAKEQVGFRGNGPLPLAAKLAELIWLWSTVRLAVARTSRPSTLRRSRGGQRHRLGRPVHHVYEEKKATAVRTAIKQFDIALCEATLSDRITALEEQLSALQSSRQASFAKLEKYRTYFDSSLWSLFEGAKKQASKESAAIREDFFAALLELREDTLEALGGVHERVDHILQQRLPALHTDIDILSARLQILEGCPEPTDSDAPMEPDEASLQDAVVEREDGRDDSSPALCFCFAVGAGRAQVEASASTVLYACGQVCSVSYGTLARMHVPDLLFALLAIMRSTPRSPDDLFVDDLLQAADAFAPAKDYSFPPEPPRVMPGKFALPTRPANSTARVTLQNDVHAKLRAKGLLLWRQLVLLLSPLSSALQEILESASSEALLSQLVSSVADTTLVRYVQSCLQYFALLQDLGFDASRISQVQAYDVMIQLYRSPEDEEEVPTSCFPLNTLKALRWMVKVATISFPDLYTGLFHSVAHQRNEADRRESVPLPLDFVAYLEFCLLSNAFPELQLNIGALLVMIWGSLRFSDAMHVKWGSLLYEQEVGRGISFRTKTSERGAPFGVVGVGLIGPWFSSWLALLKNEWGRIGNVAGHVEPDALLFHSSDDELFVPMTYGEGLATLRHLLWQWNKLSKAQVENFTLHSCKTTLLSWANQLCISEARRAVQGHHRHSSARLYSRDDVFGALTLQKELLLAIRQGWRPLCPQHRGGQVPLHEPALENRSVSFADPCFAIPGGPPSFDHASQLCPTVDVDADLAGDTFTAASGSALLSAPEKAATLPVHSSGDQGSPEELLFIITAKTIHKAVVCSELDRCTTFQGVHLKPACGCIVSVFQVVHFAPTGKKLCRHKACLEL
ncbi:unnamed protein product [Symbiodinium sp. CCMP2592]|nr:unnamed protein product [Symbiodinium sp. CCMP2592]